MEIPWPKKLFSLGCEKIRFRTEDLQPVLECGKTLEIVNLKSCEIESGALQVLQNAKSLRCLTIENCNISDADLEWLNNAPKLELLSLAGNPECTGKIISQAAELPIRRLYLNGTDLQDYDIPAILSFSNLEFLSMSNTNVTDEALPQLAVNRNLTIICNHTKEGMKQFRAAQRRNWKKKQELDEKPAGEATQLVKDFFAASQDRGRKRSGYITQRYLDYCRAHGYNGVDQGQKWFAVSSDSKALPYEDYQVVDVEQITRRKFYVYSERDDEGLSQYRYLVVMTEDGWKIDKGERLIDGKWLFWPLE